MQDEHRRQGFFKLLLHANGAVRNHSGPQHSWPLHQYNRGEGAGNHIINNCVISFAHAHMPRGPQKHGKAKCFVTVFTSEGDNEREDLEDFDTASGSSDSSSRKQGGRSFKTSWLKLFPWCIYDPLRDTAYCTDCREVGYSSEWATSKQPPPSGWKLEFLKRQAGSLEHTCVPARKHDRKEASVVYD